MNIYDNYSETYALFKSLATENHYNSLAKNISSAYCTEQTQKTIKRITKKNIKYAHMGQLVIHDGICYASFIQNPGDDGEEHDSDTSGVVLAVFTLESVMSDSFEPEKDVEYYPIGEKGGSCAGYTADSIFKDNSMCLIGDKLYVCFCFISPDNRTRLFRKIFLIKEKIWTDELLLTLHFNGNDYEFNDETLNLILSEHGCKKTKSGIIELVSAWNEYKGEYYGSGIMCGGEPNNGFIVKTKDFKTMELVAVPPFNNDGMAEISSYIFKNKLFVACRQHYAIPYLYLGVMDLETKKWLTYYKIPDGNVRPWFFEYKNELYLLHTIEEMSRRYTNISKIRVTDIGWDRHDDIAPIETMATLKNCGFYYATAEYNGEIYYVATRDTESFGRLALNFFDEETVNKKLLEIFIG